MKIKEPKSVSKSLIQNGNLIANTNVIWLKTYNSRFQSVEAYIEHCREYNVSYMTPEFMSYMSGFIKRHSSKSYSDAVIYLKVAAISKKIKLGIIKTEDQLINFIGTYEIY